MTFERQAGDRGGSSPPPAAPTGAAGKRTLTEALPPVLQAKGGAVGAPGGDDASVKASAARGAATPSAALPHGETIQRLFGRHDVSGVQAHGGAEAAGAARDMGADAYASGNHVVLGGKSDLFTVAHEAAHVVQQRSGVKLAGGVGAAGDPYEQNADQVAQRVVAGQSAESLLDQMTGQGPGQPGPAPSGGGAGAIQRLPLTTAWNPPSADVLAAVKAYLGTTLAPEMAEVTADDRSEDDKYDVGWKSKAVRCFEHLKRVAAEGNAELASQLTSDLAALLSRPVPRSRALDIRALPEEPPGRTREKTGLVKQDAAKMRDPSHREDVAASKKLDGLEAGLLSEDAGTRTGAVDQARGSDEKYTPGQGPILREFIPEYRAAMLALVRQARNADAVFSIERGGSLIADMMERMGGIEASQNRKVAKPTAENVEDHYRDRDDKPTPDKMEAMLKKPSGQKQVHMALFKQQIHDFIASRDTEQITIAVTETVVGGGSASLVLKTLNELCEELRGSKKQVQFKLLMARETIKNTGTKGRGTLKVQDPVHIDSGVNGSGVNFPEAVETTNLPQVEAFLAQTRYLIGEDVDYQVQYGGDASKKPVIVFQGAGDDLVALKITPAVGADTARQVLIDLVAGVYDRVMAEMLGAS